MRILLTTTVLLSLAACAAPAIRPMPPPSQAASVGIGISGCHLSLQEIGAAMSIDGIVRYDVDERITNEWCGRMTPENEQGFVRALRKYGYRVTETNDAHVRVYRISPPA